MTGASRVVVIAVGSEYRADDGAGPAVLSVLGDVIPDGVTLVPSDGEATRLLEAWTGAATAIVIDAVAGGAAAPGTLHRLVVTADPNPMAAEAALAGTVLADRGASSHDLGVGSAVALAMALGRMPGRLILHGIQGADFTQGIALSPPVAARIGDLAAAVLADIRAASAGATL
jgi:hydrogenase maturation protease